MSKGLTDDDKICRYLQSNMDENEEAEFLDAMKSDDGFKQNAITQARLVKGTKESDLELISAFKTAKPEDIELIINNKRPTSAVNIRLTKRRMPLFKWFSIAAAVGIVIVGSYKGYDYYNTTRLGMQFVNTFPISSITRGDSDSSVEAELMVLFTNVIERKDLESTTSRLEKLWSISQQDTYNDYTDYGPYIGWYLAIGYLENYEKSKAILVFKEIKNQYSTYTIIVDKIDKINSKLI